MAARETLRRYRDVIWAFLVFIFGLYFFWKSGEILRIQPEGQLGPDFWPRVILGCLIVLALLKGILAVRESKEAPSPDEMVPDREVQLIAPNWWRLGPGVFLILGFAYLIELIGFPLANFLFLLGFMALAGVRRARWLLTLPPLASIGFLYLFVKAVYIPLPRGEGIFEDLTISLYRLLRIF